LVVVFWRSDVGAIVEVARVVGMKLSSTKGFIPIESRELHIRSALKKE